MVGPGRSRMISAPERALSLLTVTIIVFAGSILAFRLQAAVSRTPSRRPREILGKIDPPGWHT